MVLFHRVVAVLENLTMPESVEETVLVIEDIAINVITYRVWYNHIVITARRSSHHGERNRRDTSGSSLELFLSPFILPLVTHSCN